MEVLAYEFTDDELKNLSDEEKAERALGLARQHIANCDGITLDLSGRKKNSVLSYLHRLPDEVQNLRKLQKLTFSFTKITDLSPLGNLTELQDLYCSATQITDLSPLQNLTELQKLDCSDTQITDLSPLQNLTELQKLDCSDTQITDLSPLGWLTELRELTFSFTKITDLSPLQNLTKLQKLAFLRTPITDLSPLGRLTELQDLYCSATQITDLSPLQNLTELQKLDCSDTQITDLSPLGWLTELRELTFSFTKITDLSPLGKLTELQELSCWNTQITDLSPLENLTKLRGLAFSSTKITDLSPLQNLTKLQKLAFLRTPITDLSPLGNLTKLRGLAFSSTKITDLSPLENLTELRELECFHTQITDLSPLQNLTELHKLRLSGTQITDLSPLENLTKLHRLDCADLTLDQPVPEHFWFLESLRYVHAHNTRMVGFPDEFFAGLKDHLPDIRSYLQGNIPPEIEALAQQSDTEYVVSPEGKLSPRDAPIHTNPVKIDPTALRQILEEQLAGCKGLMNSISLYPNQNYANRFKACLSQYMEEIKRKQKIVRDKQSDQKKDYAWRSMARFYGPLELFIQDDAFNDAFDPAFQNQLTSLDDTHQDLREYMQPDRRGLPAKAPPDTDPVTDEQAEAIINISKNTDLMNSLDDEGQKEFQGIAKDTEELRVDPDTSDSNRQKRWKKIRLQIVEKLAAYSVGLKKHAAKLAKDIVIGVNVYWIKKIIELLSNLP